MSYPYENVDSDQLSDRVGYDPQTETYHVQFDWGDAHSVSHVVIRSVAAVTNTDPVEIHPLYETLDPDALDALFQPTLDDTPRQQGRVSFTLDGHEITVYAYGEIIIDVASERNGGGGGKIPYIQGWN